MHIMILLISVVNPEYWTPWVRWLKSQVHLASTSPGGGQPYPLVGALGRPDLCQGILRQRSDLPMAPRGHSKQWEELVSTSRSPRKSRSTYYSVVNMVHWVYLTPRVDFPPLHPYYATAAYSACSEWGEEARRVYGHSIMAREQKKASLWSHDCLGQGDREQH